MIKFDKSDSSLSVASSMCISSSILRGGLYLSLQVICPGTNPLSALLTSPSVYITEIPVQRERKREAEIHCYNFKYTRLQ